MVQEKRHIRLPWHIRRHSCEQSAEEKAFGLWMEPQEEEWVLRPQLTNWAGATAILHSLTDQMRTLGCYQAQRFYLKGQQPQLLTLVLFFNFKAGSLSQNKSKKIKRINKAFQASMILISPSPSMLFQQIWQCRK